MLGETERRGRLLSALTWEHNWDGEGMDLGTSATWVQSDRELEWKEEEDDNDAEEPALSQNQESTQSSKSC